MICLCISPRHLHLILATLITQFPAIMVTGARQVSKSILLKHIAQSQSKYYQYINFEDPLQLARASAEPMLFMLNHTGKTELLALPISYL